MESINSSENGDLCIEMSVGRYDGLYHARLTLQMDGEVVTKEYSALSVKQLEERMIAEIGLSKIYSHTEKSRLDDYTYYRERRSQERRERNAQGILRNDFI